MRIEDQIGEPGAGVLLVAKPNAPDEYIAIKLEGDAFPRFIVYPSVGGGAAGIVVGDGTVFPEDAISSGGGLDVQAGGSLVGAARGALNLVDSLSVDFTATDDGANDRVNVSAQALVPRVAGLSIDGHSFTQLVGDDRALAAWTFPRRLAALYNIPESETFLWGRSASLAAHCQDYPGTAPFSGPGWGALLKVWGPSHRHSADDKQAYAFAQSRALPHLAVLYYVTNENGLTSDNALAGIRYPVAEVRPGFRDGLRAIVSFRRAARHLLLADTNYWSFSGMASTALSHAIKGTFRKIGANAQTATLTVPGDAKVGQVLSVALLGGPGAYCEVNTTANIGAVAITMKDDVRLNAFPTSYPFIVDIDGEAVTVTGRSGGTYSNVFAVNAIAAQHLANAAVRPRASTTVTASGTAGWTDVVNLGNRGVFGNGQVVTIRKTLTAAMIGKTIVLTSSGYIADFAPGVGVIGAWLEDPDPPPAIICEDHRRGANTAFYSTVDNTLTLNADVATVAAEFTNCAVAGVQAEIDNRCRAVIKAGSSLPAGDPAATLRSITITPDDSTKCEITVGSILRARGESLLVTAATVNGADIDITVSRGYNPGYSAGVGSTIIAHAAGLPVYDTFVTGNDMLHPSPAGHELIAKAVADAVNGLVLATPAAKMNTGGVSRVRPRYRNPAAASLGAPWYYQPRGPRTTLGSWTLNQEIMFVQEIYQSLWIDRLVAWCTSPNAANRDIVLTMRAMGEATGDLLDYGTVTAVGGGGAQTLEATVDVLVRPGLYAFGFMPVTAATSGTWRSFAPSATDWPFSVATAVPADNANEILGYAVTHGSAVPAQLAAPAAVVQQNAGVPLIGFRGYAVGRD